MRYLLSPLLILSLGLIGRPGFGQDNTNQTGSNPLALIVEQADRATSGYQTGTLSSGQFDQLRNTCELLRGIDEDRYRFLCANNPVVRKVVRPTGPRPDGSGSQSQAATKPRPTGAAPAPGLTPQAKTARVDALVEEIEDLSNLYYCGAERANALAQLKAEAKLEVLAVDLRKSLGGKAGLIPSDPLAMANPSAIAAEGELLKARERQLKMAMAYADLPTTRVTLESVQARLLRLQNISDSDVARAFHKARDELADSLDHAEWAASAATREQRAQVRFGALQRAWATRFPSLAQAAAPPKTLVKIRAEFDQTYPLSRRVLDSTRNFALDEEAWLYQESGFEALYGEQFQARLRLPTGVSKANPLPAFREWKVSLLSPADRISALRYAKAGLYAVSPVADTGNVSRDPESIFVNHASKLVEILEKSPTGAAGLTPARAVVDAIQWKLGSVEAMKPTQKVALLRVALGRYERVSMMPPGVRSAVVNIAREQRMREADSLVALYKKYTKAADGFAMANDPASNAVRSDLKSARDDLRAAMERHVAIWEDRVNREVVPVSGGPKEIRVILAALGPHPPPDGGLASAAVAPTVPPAGPAGSSGALALSDAELQVKISAADASVARLARQKVPDTAAVIRSEPGRFTVKESDLQAASASFPAMQLDAQTTRLRKDWKGLVDDKGSPFRYTDVQELKCWPDCIGGGIHLGATATADSSVDWNQFVLGYDATAKELTLAGPDGRQFRYGPVEPQILKALYRFAVHGRNGAVTIGWGGDAKDYDQFRRESAIYPDPYLADTEPGRDLILADSIPWKLDAEILPGGIKNPISAEFKAANERRNSSEQNKLHQIVITTKPLSGSFAKVLAAQFDSDLYVDLMTKAAIEADTPEQAASAFLESVGYSARKKLADSGSRLDLQLDQDLKIAKGMKEFIDRKALLMDLINQGFRLPAKKGPRASGDTFLVPDRYLKLAASLILSFKPAPTTADVTEYISAMLPTLTVAVLMDRKGSIRVEGERLVIETELVYHYLASREREANGGLLITGGQSGVVELADLASLVNKNLPTLLQIPAIARVAEYSRILALVRWATTPGTLLAVDFGSLTDFVASDRRLTPTPDAVIE